MTAFLCCSVFVQVGDCGLFYRVVLEYCFYVVINSIVRIITYMLGSNVYEGRGIVLPIV